MCELRTQQIFVLLFFTRLHTHTTTYITAPVVSLLQSWKWQLEDNLKLGTTNPLNDWTGYMRWMLFAKEKTKMARTTVQHEHHSTSIKQMRKMKFLTRSFHAEKQRSKHCLCTLNEMLCKKFTLYTTNHHPYRLKFAFDSPLNTIWLLPLLEKSLQTRIDQRLCSTANSSNFTKFWTNWMFTSDWIKFRTAATCTRKPLNTKQSRCLLSPHVRETTKEKDVQGRQLVFRIQIL